MELEAEEELEEMRRKGAMMEMPLLLFLGLLLDDDWSLLLELEYTKFSILDFLAILVVFNLVSESKTVCVL